MKIESSFRNWLGALASIFEDARAWRQKRNSLIVRKEDGCFVVRRANEADGAVFIKIPLGAQAPGESARSLRNFSIDFELAGAEVVSRRLDVPAQAREFLAGIVRNQIERLSPWPAANTVYGFGLAAQAAEATTIGVRVAIASRAMIEVVTDELTASGLAPDRILVTPQADSGPSIALWARASSRTLSSGVSTPRIIAGALAALIVLSLATTLWSAYSANALWAERDDAIARAQAVRQHQAAATSKGALASLALPERAWVMKENAPSAVVVLETLTRALPDNAYLSEFSLEHTTLRVTGLAANAPALIEALEQSKRFSGARFFAATTKAPDGDLYRFNIEAQAAPHLALVGE
jgi:general secretion pathway protein L